MRRKLRCRKRPHAAPNAITLTFEIGQRLKPRDFAEYAYESRLRTWRHFHMTTAQCNVRTVTMYANVGIS